MENHYYVHIFFTNNLKFTFLLHHLVRDILSRRLQKHDLISNNRDRALSIYENAIKNDVAFAQNRSRGSE